MNGEGIPARDGSMNGKYLVALTVMLGTLMEVLDTSVANVSLPHMQGTFSAGQDEITWVITSYLVANAVILPLSGWLGNYFGRKRTYLACLVLFTLASLAAGSAVSLPMMIVTRVVQGLAGGAMVPMSQAILLESFPREEHGKAMALFGVGVIFGPIIGPTLGGWITDTIGWPWVFYINGPIGVLGLVMGFLYITDPGYIRRPEGRVDGWSFIFIGIGLGSLEVLLNRGERYDWFHSPFIQLLALATILGLLLFVWRSLTADHPLVNLRVFRSREFATGTLMMFLLGFALYGSFTMLPLYVQSLQGYTSLLAGLVLSPGGVASLLSMAFVGLLVGRIDTRYLIAFGTVVNIFAMWMLQSVYMEVDFWFLTWPRIVQGFGMGFLFVPLTAASFASLRPEEIGQATGLFNLLRNEGGSIGIAISATVLSHRFQFHHSRMADLLGAGNTVLQERLSALAGIGLDPSTALRAIDGEMARQGLTMAYDDVFSVLTLAFVVFLPLLFFLRGRGSKDVMVH